MFTNENVKVVSVVSVCYREKECIERQSRCAFCEALKCAMSSAPLARQPITEGEQHAGHNGLY